MKWLALGLLAVALGCAYAKCLEFSYERVLPHDAGSVRITFAPGATRK
jgi:hypothetical protein